MKTTYLRIYVPIFKGLYFIASPMVQYPNGERGRIPLSTSPTPKDAIWAKEEEAKGLLVIDYELAGKDFYNYDMAAPSEGIKQTERGQIKATIKAKEDSDATFKLGHGSTIRTVVPTADKDYTTGDPVITGTYGADSLKHIGDLAALGGVRISKIHYNASDDAVYEVSPKLVKVTSTNSKTSKVLEFPTSNSNDENTHIRTMDNEYMKSQGQEHGLYFNGMNWLDFSLPQGQDVTITMYITFTPK